MLKLKHIKKKEKVNKMKTETLETISEEFEQNKEIEQKPMYTISRDMVVVETTANWSNPSSYDRDALKLFLENNREALESYFNDNDNNYGITFYECGYNGTEQQIFIQEWMDAKVRVF